MHIAHVTPYCLVSYKHVLQVKDGRSRFPVAAKYLPDNDIADQNRRSWWAAIVQSVWRFATGWTVRGSNPSGGEISCTRSDRPSGPPSLLHSGYRVFFPEVKRPGRGVNHPPPHIAPRLKKEQSYTCTPSLNLRRLLQGDHLYPFPLT